MNTFTTRFLALLAVFLIQHAAFSQLSLTAAGNQTYCPGTPTKIVTAFNITDTATTSATAVYIQISSGYVNGQDFLSLSGSIPDVTTTWDPVAAKLTIKGVGNQQVPYTTLVDAVQNVIYTNNAATPTAGTRTFSLTMGQANYLPSTQHYYMFVPSVGISWTSARSAAAASTYYGRQGYLATLLSADEAQLCGEQATGTGWIGGSDSQVEGVWRWMTGPEAGTIFWNGLANGSSPNFEFWNNQEPNNAGDEDYAHITAPGVGIPGSWNDLPVIGGNGDYAPKGYIIEYGGMPGDNPVDISASTTINLPAIVNVTPQSVCGPSSVTLSAVVTGGTMVYWYNSPTGGLPIATGSSFTTPLLLSTSTYYASAYDETCTTATRKQVIATIKPLPTVTSAPNVSVCAGDPVTLTGTVSAGTIYWFTQPTGGIAVGAGTYIPNITTNTTYFAEALDDGCPSSTRTQVTVTFNPRPIVTVPSPVVSVCSGSLVTLTASASSGIINWFDTPTGGTILGTGNFSPNITANTTYYAEANDGGCLSAREAVTLNFNALPTLTVIIPAPICQQGTTTIEAVASSGTISWFTALTGGTAIATGPSFVTPILTADTTFYAEVQDITGCTTPSRIAVTAVVNMLPTVLSAPDAAVCSGSHAVLEATPSAGTISWYKDLNGGTALGTGTTFTTPALTADTVFYAEADISGCVSAVREAVAVTVNALPVVTDESVFFCEGGEATLDAGVTGATYDWVGGETTQVITVDEPGTYSIEVTNTAGCSATKTFTVTERFRPMVDVVSIGGATIMVELENENPQDYEYSLDNVNWQESNTFRNLPSGPGTVFIREINGCGSNFGNYVIRIVPNYFTPNNDNINDLFSIAGISAYPNATLTVFDRYGKIITFLNRANNSWDGTYNNVKLPASDYWYVLKLDKSSEEIRGHFSLIR